MSNGFTFFEGTTTESAEVARITVRKGGILVLTAAAVGMLGDEVERVQVGFNPETGAIGLRAAAEGAAGSYRLRQQKGTPARLVDGKRVFAHHGLTADKARSYEAEDFGDGVVGFVLERPDEKGAGEPASSKRTRAAKAKHKSQTKK
jgi:hypothetical protein